MASKARSEPAVNPVQSGPVSTPSNMSPATITLAATPPVQEAPSTGSTPSVHGPTSSRQQQLNKTWHIGYKLPEFPSYIKDKLNDGQMLVEFQRLEGSHTMDELLNDGLEKYSYAIVKCVKSLKKRPELVEKAIAKAATERDEKSRKESVKCAAVLAVPVLMNEKLQKMLVMADETDLDLLVCMQMTPGEDDTEYSVVVDFMKLASSRNFLTCFANYLAVFYCLNLAYPATLKKTLKFFQKVVLNVEDDSQVEKSVVKILEKVNLNLQC